MFNNCKHIRSRSVWPLVNETIGVDVTSKGSGFTRFGQPIYDGTYIIVGGHNRPDVHITGIERINSSYVSAAVTATVTGNYEQVYYDGSNLAFTGGTRNWESTTQIIAINTGTYALLGAQLFTSDGESTRGIIKLGSYYFVYDRKSDPTPTDNQYYWYTELTPVTLHGVTATYSGVVDKCLNVSTNSYNCYDVAGTRYFQTYYTGSYYYPCLVTSDGSTNLYQNYPNTLTRPFDNSYYYGGTIVNGKAWYITDSNYIVAYDISTLAYQSWLVDSVNFNTITVGYYPYQSKIDNKIYLGSNSTITDYIYYLDIDSYEIVRVPKNSVAAIMQYWTKAFDDKPHCIARNGNIYALE